MGFASFYDKCVSFGVNHAFVGLSQGSEESSNEVTLQILCWKMSLDLESISIETVTTLWTCDRRYYGCVVKRRSFGVHGMGMPGLGLRRVTKVSHDQEASLWDI